MPDSRITIGQRRTSRLAHNFTVGKCEGSAREAATRTLWRHATRPMSTRRPFGDFWRANFSVPCSLSRKYLILAPQRCTSDALSGSTGSAMPRRNCRRALASSTEHPLSCAGLPDQEFQIKRANGAPTPALVSPSRRRKPRGLSFRGAAANYAVQTTSTHSPDLW